VNKINRLTTINGEKTNGRTKIVSTVKLPEEILMEHVLHRGSFDSAFDSEFFSTSRQNRAGNAAWKYCHQPTQKAILNRRKLPCNQHGNLPVKPA